MNAQLQHAFERNRESLACGDFDPLEIQVTDEHYEAAIDKVIDTDIATISDALFDSAWSTEHIGRFAANDKAFRKELRDHTMIITAAALIAENELAARREQETIDSAFGE